MINNPAPQPEIECWAQGGEPEISELAGQVILIEVIQVNCPGCFVHALPEAIRLHQTYGSQGLRVFAIATAFEHFEQNTLLNLQRLLHDGELQGDPLLQLGNAGYLEHGRLPYSIPFSVAMDKLVKNHIDTSEKAINRFILSQIPDFFHSDLSEEHRHAIYQQAENHLRAKTFNAATFEMYQLQGTPSSILIDKRGFLRQISLGIANTLEADIQHLLKE